MTCKFVNKLKYIKLISSYSPACIGSTDTIVPFSSSSRQLVLLKEKYFERPGNAVTRSVRCNHNVAFSSFKNQISMMPGAMSIVWQKLGFTGKLKYRKSVLKASALRLYLCCMELVNHDDFIKELSLPDTFNSWFRVTELHIWFCLVRLAQEGKEGEIVRNALMDYLWRDLLQKVKKLQTMSNSEANAYVQTLSQELKGSLYAYDEGLLGDDKVLAGALWRSFFQRNCDAEQLETLLRYVRKQVAHLDAAESKVILRAGLLPFLPFINSPSAQERSKEVMMQIVKRT